LAIVGFWMAFSGTFSKERDHWIGKWPEIDWNSMICSVNVRGVWIFRHGFVLICCEFGLKRWVRGPMSSNGLKNLYRYLKSFRFDATLSGTSTEVHDQHFLATMKKFTSFHVGCSEEYRKKSGNHLPLDGSLEWFEWPCVSILIYLSAEW
jgi:hypothetical protein